MLERKFAVKVLLAKVQQVVMMNFLVWAGVAVGLLAPPLLPAKVGMAMSGPRWWRVHPHRRLSSTPRSQARTRTRSNWQPLRCPMLLLGIGFAVWASWFGAPPAAGPGRAAAELLGLMLATARWWKRSSQATRPGCSLYTQSSSFEGSPSV